MPAERPISTYVPPERAVLVGVDRGVGEWDIETSMDELERLAETDGATTVGRLVQRLDRPMPRTFIGSGKIEELRQLAESLEADIIIFDDELSPSQQSNIERAVGLKFKVIDRTALILDIFGQHASTHEGKLQVQMAQLQYLYPRLRGMWAHLAKDKTRGGIGSRFGQGESQLEVDRRLIRNRMSTLRHELSKVAGNREVQRKERWSSSMFRISLAGYTNAGKSTLLNRLTGANVYVRDQLFATLDPTTRTLELPGGRAVTLTDTVGFIQKLPTTLVESFKSTLSEVSGAHLILEVADATDENCDKQLRAVDEVLGQIGAEHVPLIVVYNKVDLLDEEARAALQHRHPQALLVSAQTGEGVDGLVSAIARAASSQDETIQAVVPYGEGMLIKACHEKGHMVSSEYAEDGVHLTVIAPPLLAARLKRYQVSPSEIADASEGVADEGSGAHGEGVA